MLPPGDHERACRIFCRILRRLEERDKENDKNHNASLREGTTENSRGGDQGTTNTYVCSTLS